MTDSATVDTQALAPDDAKELQNVIQKSKVLEGSSQSARQPNASPEMKTNTKKGAADYFTYKITIQNGDKEQTMECNDINMQANVKGLVDFVRKHGQK